MIRKGCLFVSMLMLVLCVASFAVSTFDTVKIVGKWEVKEINQGTKDYIRMELWKSDGMTKMYYDYDREGNLCIERHYKDQIEKENRKWSITDDGKLRIVNGENADNCKYIVKSGYLKNGNIKMNRVDALSLTLILKLAACNFFILFMIFLLFSFKSGKKPSKDVYLCIHCRKKIKKNAKVCKNCGKSNDISHWGESYGELEQPIDYGTKTTPSAAPVYPKPDPIPAPKPKTAENKWFDSAGDL